MSAKRAALGPLIGTTSMRPTKKVLAQVVQQALRHRTGAWLGVFSRYPAVGQRLQKALGLHLLHSLGLLQHRLDHLAACAIWQTVYESMDAFG